MPTVAAIFRSLPYSKTNGPYTDPGPSPSEQNNSYSHLYADGEALRTQGAPYEATADQAGAQSTLITTSHPGGVEPGSVVDERPNLLAVGLNVPLSVSGPPSPPTGVEEFYVGSITFGDDEPLASWNQNSGTVLLNLHPDAGAPGGPWDDWYWVQWFAEVVGLSTCGINTVTRIGDTYTVEAVGAGWLQNERFTSGVPTFPTGGELSINGVVTSVPVFETFSTNLARFYFNIDDSEIARGPIRFRTVTGWAKSPWVTLIFYPSPRFVAEVDESAVTIDASSSVSIGRAIATYHWFTPTGTFVTNTPNFEYDLQEVEDAFNAGNTEIEETEDGLLRFKLALGATDTSLAVKDLFTVNGAYQWFTVDRAGGQIGVVCDPQGVIFTAVKVGSHSKVFRFNSNNASRQKLATLTNHKSPTLRLDHRQRLLIAAQDSTGMTQQYVSADKGRSFT